MSDLREVRLPDHLAAYESIVLEALQSVKGRRQLEILVARQLTFLYVSQAASEHPKYGAAHERFQQNFERATDDKEKAVLMYGFLENVGGALVREGLVPRADEILKDAKILVSYGPSDLLE